MMKKISLPFFYALVVGVLFSGCKTSALDRDLDALSPLGGKRVRATHEQDKKRVRDLLFSQVEQEEKSVEPKERKMPTPSLATVEPVPPAAVTAVPYEGKGAYVLRPGDTVTINLQEIPEAQIIQDELDEYGKISLIFIGEVMAAGKTASELERDIEAKYIDGDYYKRVTASVVVPTKSYTIRGEVNQSGRFMISGRTSLLQAVAAAGGFNEFANPKKITIFRGNEIIRKNFREIEKKPELDIEIKSEDSIFVARSIW